MRLPVFYALPDNIESDKLCLEKTEAHHAQKVMRLKKGEPLIVVDGIGNGYRCELTGYSSGKAACHIFSRTRGFGEPASFVTLACGLSVGTKFDSIIQRATELGVSRLIPLLTQKSKVSIDTDRKIKSKLSRWRKVAISSMKQTERSRIPDIWSPTRFDLFFDMYEEPSMRILFDPNSGETGFSRLKLPSDARHIVLMVGPESGFSHDEINLAKKHDAVIMTLGSRILRAENAAPAALALVIGALGEFS